MIISKDQTRAAFSGESRTGLGYLACARQAEKEGYPQIATLFQDTARAESAYAFLSLPAPGRLGAAAAANTGAKEPPGSRSAARDRGKKHDTPYQKALKRLAESAKGDYCVCTGCGSIWESRHLEKCPRCRSEAINSVKVG